MKIIKKEEVMLEYSRRVLNNFQLKYLVFGRKGYSVRGLQREVVFLAARLDTKLHKGILFLSDIDKLLAKQRCALSEKRTKEALERLKRKLLIVDYMRVSKIKKMDDDKIDFIITTIKGACYMFVPLQVKSSETGLIEHKRAMRQMRKKGIKGMLSNIAVIIVNKRDSIEDICKKILNAIS